MVRRSFRVGLWAGLLLGVAAAVVKTMQGRRDGKELTSPPPDRWAPAPAATVATPAAAPFAPAPVATPAPPEPAAPSPAPPETDRWDSEPWPTDIVEAPEAEAPAAEDAEDGEPGEAGWGETQPALDERQREEPVVEPPPPRLVKSVPAGEAPAAKPAATPRKTVAAAKRVADTAKRTPAVKATTWVRPVAGVCPPTHPVKGKLASRLFHLPGMFAYDRTRADRCYISEAAAVADGLTRAKR